jgi:hypothetical protein
MPAAGRRESVSVKTLGQKSQGRQERKQHQVSWHDDDGMKLRDVRSVQGLPSAPRLQAMEQDKHEEHKCRIAVEESHEEPRQKAKGDDFVNRMEGPHRANGRPK